MRTFIAVDLAADIKINLSGFVRKLKRISPPAIHWVREEGMHVTLKFLGEIEENQAGVIGGHLRTMAGETPAFPLIVRGAGTFPPPPGNPRVLWIGLEENPPLQAFQERLETTLETLGFPRERRPFHPHLTLGRIKAPGGLGAVLEMIVKNGKTSWGEMMVKEVIFFRSVLKPFGAEYTPLFKGPFQQ